jgi:hypothetical protein
MCMAATSCSYSRANWCGRGDGVRRVGVRRRKLPVQQSELDKHRARGEPGTTASWRRQAPHGQVVDGDGSSMGQGSWLCAILVAVVDQSAALLKKGVQVSPSQGAMTSRAGVALKSGLTATSACGHLRRQTKPDNDAEGQLCFGPWVCVCVPTCNSNRQDDDDRDPQYVATDPIPNHKNTVSANLFPPILVLLALFLHSLVRNFEI